MTWQKVNNSREIFFMIVSDNLSQFKVGIRKKLRWMNYSGTSLSLLVRQN